MTAGELEALWANLLVPTEIDATAVCATGATAGDIDVVIGTDYLGRRHVMVPLGASRISLSLRAAGIRAVAPRPLVHAGTKRNYLDVCCVQPDLRTIFARLAAEIVSEAARAGPDAGRRCAGLLDGWRDMFGTISGGFGRLQAVGLLGELIVLRELAMHQSSVVTTWTGPLGGVHDFRHGLKAIEVKATLRRHGRFHTISSLEQLAIPEGGRLAFVSIRLEPVPGGPLSITGLIRDLTVSGVSAFELAQRVEEAGLKLGSSPELEQECFEQREFELYEVSDDFPRIVPGAFVAGTLPTGVVALRYDIDLSSERPRPLGKEDAGKWLKEFLPGYAT
jgi:hypothetical protein